MVIGGTEILLNIAGGVALLLWGVRMVRTGVTRAFGAGLRRLIAASTRNRLAAFGVGIGVTALLQSSTATALIVASFAGGGLIAATAALAVMLGADVGTTLVAQVLSLDVGFLSPALVIIGVVAHMTAAVGPRRHLGRVAIGLGLMLLALQLIVGASAPLREAPALGFILAPLAQEALLAVLLAALLTWLAHSSLAVVLLIMSLAATNVVPLPLAFALVIGANIGGAISPVMMTMGSGREARRVPVGNLLMRLVGGLAMLPLIGLVVPLLPELGAAPARQVVNFHTAFNLGLAIVFLPLIDAVAALVARLLPAEPRGEDPSQPRYLDPAALDTPSVALASAARETLRMGDLVETMLARSIDVFQNDDAGLAREIEETDDIVDTLHEAIKLYLTKASAEELEDRESRRCVEILTFTTNLEHIGDIIDKNLMELAHKKIRKQVSFSVAGLKEIQEFHAHVVANMQLAFNIFMEGDVKLARQLLAEKISMRDLEISVAESHFDRLRAGRPETIQTTGLHLDIIRDLKRINGHLTAVAYPILEAAGELTDSRLRKGKRASDPAAPADADAVDPVDGRITAGQP